MARSGCNRDACAAVGHSTRTWPRIPDFPAFRHNVAVIPLIVGSAVVESLRPTLVPRTTVHQALVTGGCALTAAVVAKPVTLRTPRWLLVAGAGVGLWRSSVHVKAQREAYPAWDPRPQNTPLAVAAGTLAGLALPRVGVALARRGWWGLGAAAATATAAHLGLRKLRAIGVRADPALREPPHSEFVSGGPASGVDYATLARDGRRFVSLRTPAEEIRTVDPAAIEPIRVYVGLHTAATVEERVAIAVSELERLGGFERSNLLIMCPAGSGYADYVAAEAIECFTRGDVASVVIQYGVLPSMLSLGRVRLGAQTARMLLDAVAGRTHGRVVMYGESLGARVAQEALQIAPSRVDDEGRVSGVDAVVSVGTPGGPSLRERFLRFSGVVHLDRWQQLTGQEKAQLWFIDHDADPVTKWDRPLAVRKPWWLRGTRGRNVPADMAWLPLLTWWQVLFDMTFAAQQQSGVFRSIGHDYRADLPPVLSAVLGGGADVDAVAGLLAVREVARDEIVGLKLPAVST